MKRGNIRFICKHCGKESLVFPADVRKGGGVFCSFACRVAYKKEHGVPFDRKKWHDAWYQEHKEHVKARDATRKAADPEAWKAKKNASQRRRRAANPEPFREAARRHKMKNPAYHRPGHYKRKYGVTVEFVKAEVAAQGNRCKICNEEFVKTPHVDHDHVTGKYRSMLDFGCNRGLGCFKDDPALIFKSLLYLVNHKTIPTIS
jgi:hypothetical protein